MILSRKKDLKEANNDANKESQKLLTIVGDTAKVEGKFTISQSIEIDCEIKGELEVDGRIIIQKDGYVDADVKTVDAQIIGMYKGNMEATGKVEINETGKVEGNIKTDSLIINQGGIFSGNVERITGDKEENGERLKSRKNLESGLDKEMEMTETEKDEDEGELKENEYDNLKL